MAVPLVLRRRRARLARARSAGLGHLVTSGSSKEVRTACKNIKCAKGRICYCDAFVVPPDCWCGDVIVYADGSTNAAKTQVNPKRARKRRGRRY